MARTAQDREAKTVVRCAWPGTDPLYVAYHDDEWGVPERDSPLFEKLLLDGFQAGLSGSPSCASAMRSVPPFAASIRRRSPASPLPTGSG